MPHGVSEASLDRVDRICERARTLAEAGVDLQRAAPELLELAQGERWVVEAARQNIEETARRTADGTSMRAAVLLSEVLDLGILR